MINNDSVRPSSVLRRLSSVVRRPSSVVRRPPSVVRRPEHFFRSMWTYFRASLLLMVFDCFEAQLICPNAHHDVPFS
jgi:hypothetical protein